MFKRLPMVLVLLTLFVFEGSSQAFIRRDGNKLRFQDQEIFLRGISFGNRVWINDPYPDQHHGEEDYNVVKNLGMNAIRFYLNYLTFENDDAPYVYKNKGWEWVDKNIVWAKANGIYLILNMHVPQGGFQSMCGGDALWDEPENQTRLAALWKAIAQRYKDEPQIAGYDIVNEPIPTRSVAQWSELAQRIIDSIRSVDQNHLIITERAIALDCDYTYNDGKFNYPDITEENIMYTVHLYDPYEYTHQNQSWANTSDGGKYPDENIVYPPSDNEYHTGQYANPSIASGTNDWKYFEGKPFLVNAPNVSVGRVVFTGRSLGNGKVFFDDIILTEVDAQGKELRVIFQTGQKTGMNYWIWSQHNDGVLLRSTEGMNDDFAIGLTGTSGGGSITAADLTFKAEHGKRYKISGYMRGEQVPVGANATITTEFYTSPSGAPTFVRNKEYIRHKIMAYSQYLVENNYPVYFGEFGVVRNAFEQDKGGHLWTKDAMEIFRELGFHFTYHVYREDPFGYFAGWDGPIDRSTKLKDLETVFKEFFGHVSNFEVPKRTQINASIFPNPFNSEVTLQNMHTSQLKVTIMNSLGSIVAIEEIPSGTTRMLGEGLPKGMYLIKVSTGNKADIYKVIKN